jgi:hypothetical protein
VVSGVSGAGSRPAASSPATRAPRSSRKARRSAKAARSIFSYSRRRVSGEVHSITVAGTWMDEDEGLWWCRVAPRCFQSRDSRTPFFEEGKTEREGSVRRFRMPPGIG